MSSPTRKTKTLSAGNSSSGSCKTSSSHPARQDGPPFLVLVESGAFALGIAYPCEITLLTSEDRKTQIAIQYAHWVYQNLGDVSVFWVHATNAERFRQDYAAIAQACEISNRDNYKADVLALVKDYLEKNMMAGG